MLITIVIVAAIAGVLAVWAGIEAARDRPVTGPQVPAIAVVECALVVQTALTAVWMVQGRGKAEPALLWGYLVTELVLLPAAFGWAFLERSRWSSVVLAVAAVVVVVLQVRVWQIWQGQG